MACSQARARRRSSPSAWPYSMKSRRPDVRTQARWRVGGRAIALDVRLDPGVGVRFGALAVVAGLGHQRVAGQVAAEERDQRGHPVARLVVGGDLGQRRGGVRGLLLAQLGEGLGQHHVAGVLVVRPAVATDPVDRVRRHIRVEPQPQGVPLPAAEPGAGLPQRQAARERRDRFGHCRPPSARGSCRSARTARTAAGPPAGDRRPPTRRSARLPAAPAPAAAGRRPVRSPPVRPGRAGRAPRAPAPARGVGEPARPARPGAPDRWRARVPASARHPRARRCAPAGRPAARARRLRASAPRPAAGRRSTPAPAPAASSS